MKLILLENIRKFKLMYITCVFLSISTVPNSSWEAHSRWVAQEIIFFLWKFCHKTCPDLLQNLFDHKIYSLLNLLTLAKPINSNERSPLTGYPFLLSTRLMPCQNMWAPCSLVPWEMAMLSGKFTYTSNYCGLNADISYKMFSNVLWMKAI
jgi:hypothetical protein